MKIISFNVNGIRAIMKKDFAGFLAQHAPDVLCLEEIKCDAETAAALTFEGYKTFFAAAERRGYSGTMTLLREQPISVIRGLSQPLFDSEGRTLTVETKDLFIVNTYSPNSKEGLARIDYRESYDAALLDFAAQLQKKKPTVICGDFNVAHKPIDLAHPDRHEGDTGFSKEEREGFSRFLEAGFFDGFRALYPDLSGAYSWWSYLRRGRLTNAGWRLDYTLLSEPLRNRLSEAFILSDVMGSDHCPVGIILE